MVFQRFDSKVLVAKLINIIRQCVDPSQKQGKYYGIIKKWYYLYLNFINTMIKCFNLVGEDLMIIRYAMKLLSCLCLRDTSAL